MKPNWHKTFLDLAKVYAQRSDDTHTKLGAVIVDPTSKIVASAGYNGIARGVSPKKERLQRPAKYDYMVHAEANALYNAARRGVSVKGCVLYCGWPPCQNCAMAIIQAGISHIVVETRTIRESWKKSMEIALRMLNEAGVKVKVYEEDKAQAFQFMGYAASLEVLSGLVSEDWWEEQKKLHEKLTIDNPFPAPYTAAALSLDVPDCHLVIGDTETKEFQITEGMFDWSFSSLGKCCDSHDVEGLLVLNEDGFPATHSDHPNGLIQDTELDKKIIVDDLSECPHTQEDSLTFHKVTYTPAKIRFHGEVPEKVRNNTK